MCSRKALKPTLNEFWTSEAFFEIYTRVRLFKKKKGLLLLVAEKIQAKASEFSTQTAVAVCQCDVMDFTIYMYNFCLVFRLFINEKVL